MDHLRPTHVRPSSNAIQVRRVRHRPGSNEPLHVQELVREEFFGTQNAPPIGDSMEAASEPLLPEDSQEFDVRSQWGLEQNSLPDEIAVEEGSEISESASVFTLYFSQQETIISGGETEKLTAECDDEEEKEHGPADDYKFRFTRVQAKKGERSRSAPARPLTELEEFKESCEFASLESAAMEAGDILQKGDDKLDLDSADGHGSCKKFLDHIEELARHLKVLYKDGSLCYLTEILDSAQEGFPYIVVNGEKYIFSPNVLRTGEHLFAEFLRLKDCVREVYNMLCEDCVRVDLRRVLCEFRGNLEDFDRAWVRFEKIYVLELMLIERDARRYVLRAVELEAELKSCEMLERLKGRVVIRSPAYDRTRKRFVDLCCQINSVANYIGKGRDDLTIDVLIAAEEVSRKVSNYKSRAVRKLAGQIKSTFLNLRLLFRKYGENLEAVDPQLKNNGDLVDALVAFEKAWEKGKDFLLNRNVSSMLISFSQLIEGLAEKYKELRDKIESMDADVFIIIPCLAILRSLDENDRRMYNFYYPELGLQSSDHEAFSNLKQMYLAIKSRGEGYAVYNALEQAILEKESSDSCNNSMQMTEGGPSGVKKEEMNKLLHEIKGVAMLLQRNKPTEWNALMETAMGII